MASILYKTHFSHPQLFDAAESKTNKIRMGLRIFPFELVVYEIGASNQTKPSTQPNFHFCSPLLPKN